MSLTCFSNLDKEKKLKNQKVVGFLNSHKLTTEKNSTPRISFTRVIQRKQNIVLLLIPYDILCFNNFSGVVFVVMIKVVRTHLNILENSMFFSNIGACPQLFCVSFTGLGADNGSLGPIWDLS